MIRGTATQPFASPEEALTHHGVKGMKWGVRKDDDPVEREHAKARTNASTNEAAKRELTKDMLTEGSQPKGLMQPIPVTSTSKPVSAGPKPSKQELEKAADRKGLTSGQKKALVALGVTAGVAGYIAYKHYQGSPLIDPRDYGAAHPDALLRDKLSKRGIGGIGLGPGQHKDISLLRPEGLVVDISKGYANIVPKGGFANPETAARHADLIEQLDAFREKYPKLRNMNIEVVPMSHDPLFGSPEAMAGVFAYVQAMGPGEARIAYNDVMGKPSTLAKYSAEHMFPGMTKKGNLGAHEMGHLLASAGSIQLPSYDYITAKTPGDQFVKGLAFGKPSENLHKQMLEKHGLTFKELSKLSPYAATKPQEALAELSRYYHIKENNHKLSPETLRKAEALFNELGGVNVDSPKRPERIGALA